MATIHKPDNKPFDGEKMLQLKAKLIPSFRVLQAEENKARTNILFRMHGGLGDIICAEPSIRYAMKHFKGLKFSLVTLYPEVFQHLPFENIYSLNNINELNQNNHLMFDNTDTSNELAAEFIAHPLMHAVDYASLYMWRMILPNKDKEIQLVPNMDQLLVATGLSKDNDVLIHPGRTWKTRTFPKKFWDRIISLLIAGGARPVIIGGDIDNGRANTVDVDVPEGAIDLRFKLSIMESVALMHNSKVLLTNDSAPLHMATTGDTWIGYLSTVKHTDHLTAWRKGSLGWHMEDLALGRVYDSLDVCPNKKDPIRVDDCDVRDMLSWLPTSDSVAAWALGKLKE